MGSQSTNMTYKMLSSIATKRGMDTDEILKDFKKLTEIKEQTEAPSRMNLSSDEKTMGLGALMRAKTSQSKGCTTDELDAEMENIRVKYNLNADQSKMLTDQISSTSKDGGSAIIRFIILLLSMGTLDVGG